MLWFYKINDVETHHTLEFFFKIYNCTSVVVVRITKKIVGPPDPLSCWSCGPLLLKVFVKYWTILYVMIIFSGENKETVFWH